MKKTNYLILGLIGLMILAACEPIEAVPPPATTIPTVPPPVDEEIQLIDVGIGDGYAKDFWQVYFNRPTGSRDRSTYVNGIDVPLANAIQGVQRSLDIAAFELNNEVIGDAILDAHNRGVTVRIVTDNEHGIDDDDSILFDLQEEGIPIVDDSRSALMHNKFMILDGVSVWTGSWNYTINGTYRNDNNALVLRSQRAVAAYQAEFNEMFEDRRFGPTSPDTNVARYTQDGSVIEVLFASEGNVIQRVVDEVMAADRDIRFMTFVFSSDSTAEAILQRAQEEDITIQGIFENRNSTADWSHLPTLFCAGLPVRQDTNSFILHHKVFIIDDDTVVTGSFNFSGNASRNNDENLLIIKNKDIAGLYLAEFERLWNQSRVPTNVTC